jgi:sulfur carrier protein
MRVTVNSDPIELPDGTRVSDLVAHLNLTGTRVAVEVNRRIVPRAQHPEHVLHPGDTIEVVTLVGGG